LFVAIPTTEQNLRSLRSENLRLKKERGKIGELEIGKLE
jgi:stress response protein YsnF